MRALIASLFLSCLVSPAVCQTPESTDAYGQAAIVAQQVPAQEPSPVRPREAAQSTETGRSQEPGERTRDEATQPKPSTLEVKPGPPAIKAKDLYEGPGYIHPFGRMPRYILSDQKAIWTSPFHNGKRNIKYWAIFGGAATIYGPIAAVFILFPLLEFFRFWPEYRTMIFAAVVLIILLYMPEGFIRWIRDKIEKECPRCKIRNAATRKTCRVCTAGLD